MCIFLSLILFGPCGRGAKVGNKWNSISTETIFLGVPHPGSLFLTSCIFQLFLLYYPITFHNKCTIQTAYVRTEWGFFRFHYFLLNFHHPLCSGTRPFCSLLSSSYFLQKIHHDGWRDVSCTFYKIYLTSYYLGTNINIGHLW